MKYCDVNDIHSFVCFYVTFCLIFSCFFKMSYVSVIMPVIMEALSVDGRRLSVYPVPHPKSRQKGIGS